VILDLKDKKPSIINVFPDFMPLTFEQIAKHLIKIMDIQNRDMNLSPHLLKVNLKILRRLIEKENK
jgi:hypothetical protein